MYDYANTKIWDGTNVASVSNGALNTNISGGSINVEMTAEITGASLNATITNYNTSRATNSAVAVGLTVTQIVDTNATRRVLNLFNAGGSNIWLGITSTMSAGAAGINAGYLTPGNSKDIEYYSGKVYGLIEGVSGDAQYIKVTDIG